MHINYANLSTRLPLDSSTSTQLGVCAAPYVLERNERNSGGLSKFLLYLKAHRSSCSKSLLAKVIRYIEDTITSSVSNHYTYYEQSSATLGEVY